MVIKDNYTYSFDIFMQISCISPEKTSIFYNYFSLLRKALHTEKQGKGKHDEY